MTIYAIKYRLQDNPHFFSRASLRFFGQTLKMFSVCKYGKGYRLTCPMLDRFTKRRMGETVRFFCPELNTFVKQEQL